MRFLKHPQTRTNFVAVPNDFIRRRDLPRDAKGLLVELMSHSDSFDVTVAGLVTDSDGRTKVRRMLEDLEAAGLVHRFQKRGAAGKFGAAAFVGHWYEFEPGDLHLDGLEPIAGFPTSGEPTSADDPHKKKRTTEENTNTREDDIEDLGSWFTQQIQAAFGLNIPVDAGRIALNVFSTFLEKTDEPRTAARLARRYGREKIATLAARNSEFHRAQIVKYIIADASRWYESAELAEEVESKPSTVADHALLRPRAIPRERFEAVSADLWAHYEAKPNVARSLAVEFVHARKSGELEDARAIFETLVEQWNVYSLQTKNAPDDKRAANLLKMTTGRELADELERIARGEE